MKTIWANIAYALLFTFALLSCGGEKTEKGFAVASIDTESDDKPTVGIFNDSLNFPSRPGTVLLTGNPRFRLTPIFKVNFRKDSTTFTGGNGFHFNYEFQDEESGNNWNGNYLPGLEAIYGFNMVNISHFDAESQTQKFFFSNPVLVKTLYFPSYSKDTLNYLPIVRNYFLVSVFDEDTNKDGFINPSDLRRFYSFDINAGNKKHIVPKNYSVFKSEYDPAMDRLMVFVKLDSNSNGQVEDLEPIHIYWVDLKNPERTGRQF